MKRLILAATAFAMPAIAQVPPSTVPSPVAPPAAVVPSTGVAPPAPVAPPSPIAPAAPIVTATPAAALPRVAIDTSAGRFVLELETKRAPITAANFLRYVDGRRLDGRTIYRVSHVAPRFGFIQFGVNGDPKLSLPPIRHEPTTVTGVKHLEGTISTARLGLGTARGEFTIMVGDQPGLDADPTKPGDNQGYAAFGRVVEGFDTVLRIFGMPIDPAATLRGAFKGEVPAAPARILTVRRVCTSIAR